MYYMDFLSIHYIMRSSGFGAYLAIPLIRERWSPDMEEGEARALLEDCLRVLFYRCATNMHTYIHTYSNILHIFTYKKSLHTCINTLTSIR